MKLERQKYVAWLADGGTTHMLCNLGACLRYAAKSGRKILPLTINQSTLQDHFYCLFDLQKESILSNLFVFPEDYAQVFCDYVPSSVDLPDNLYQTKIDKERIDSNGKVYYTLYGLKSVGGQVRYLDYPDDESPEYVLTWAGFEQYFRKQLEIVLCTLRLHSSISTEVLLKVRNTSNNIQAERYLSAHFRNTDYASDISILFSKLDEELEKHPKAKIFWATDDSSSIKIAEQRYGWRIVAGCVPVDVRSFPGLASLHSLSDNEFAVLSDVSRRTLFSDFFHDIYFMSRSIKHFGSSGNVGFLVNSVKLLSSEARASFFGFM